MKKTISFLLALIMSLSMLTGIAFAEEKIKLQFMGWEASVYETEANLAAIKRFEDAYPQYEVEFITGKFEDHHTRLMTMMAGNAAPDVFYMEPQYMNAFVELGLLADISEVFENEFKDVELIDWSYQKMESKDGAMYGIDSCIVGMVLFINPALFKEAGLEVPTTKEALTWEELVELAQKLTIRDENGIVSQYGVYGFENLDVMQTYWYYNDVMIVNDEGNIEFSDPQKAIEIMDKLKGLRTEYAVAPEAAFIENSGMSPNQLLQTGKVAMVMNGSFSIQELSTMGFEYIAVKPPVIDEEHPVGIMNSSYNCAVWSGTKYPEIAKALAACLTAEEGQMVFVRDGLWMTNRKYLYEEENYPLWLTDAYPEGWADLAPLFRDGVFKTTGLLPGANEVIDIMTEEMENYWYQDQAADATLENITRRTNVVIERNK